jgi:hypothetical protein
MQTQIVVVIAVVLSVLVVGGAASAQTQRTDTCVDGIADVYRFRPAAFTQNEIRVTVNRNNPGFFLLIFDSDVDVVGIVHSNSRSLHWSTGMLRDRYEVWVGCVRSASYTIQWVNGNEKRLSPPRYVSYLTGADLGGKTTAVEPSRDIRSEYALQRARVRQIVAERNQ